MTKLKKLKEARRKKIARILKSVDEKRLEEKGYLDSIVQRLHNAEGQKNEVQEGQVINEIPIVEVQEKVDVEKIEDVVNERIRAAARAAELEEEKVELNARRANGKNYEMLGFVCFHVAGENFDFGNPRNIAQVNDLLIKFCKQIEAIRIDDLDMRIAPTRVDEFSSQIVGNTLRCAQQIMWNIVDFDTSGTSDNFNIHVQPLICRHLNKIRLEDSKGLIAETMQTAFGYNRPVDRLWPPGPELQRSRI